MEETKPQPTEFTPEEIASASPAYWSHLHEIRLQDGIFTFKDHEYQIEVMDDRARRQCDMKATQGGFSQMRILQSLHGMIYGRLPQGVLTMLPTGDDVSEFSKSRFGPLIAANHRAIGRYVRDTDSTTLKKVGKSFLFLRGARLSQKIDEDAKESSKLRSISVDRLVFDELDLMDEDVIEKARGRLGASKVKEEIFISNPTLPDFGISKMFALSDQRHWFRKCDCGYFTCAELSFPQCVKIGPDGKGYIACDKCGKPVGITPGEWVAQCKANTEFMVGRRWSQLTSAVCDPAEILRDYENPPQGNLADVYRLRLGLPYVAAEDRLQEYQVLARCGNDCTQMSHPGPAAMGVDVGKIKHVVIGLRTGNDQYEIIRATSVSEWSDLHDLAKRYGVRSAVVDIRPYEDSARQFQKGEGYPVTLCEYAESMPSGPQWNPNTGIVKVNRTEIFDTTHRVIATDGMLKLPRLCPEIKEFARQCCNTAKVQEKNKRTGVIVYRYRALGSGDDHFRNALNYFMLAAGGGKVARVDGGSVKSSSRVVNHYRVGVRN